MSALARSSQQFGQVLRRARRQRKWSQRELGANAGLRQETISLIENGRTDTGIETLLCVLAALDLELQIAPRSKSDWSQAMESHF